MVPVDGAVGVLLVICVHLRRACRALVVPVRRGMLLLFLNPISFGQVTVVARIQCIEIASNRQLPIDLRILGLEVRFIEIVHMFHASAFRRLNH